MDISQATGLMDVIVDRVLDEEEPGGPHQELQFTDKIFFYEVCYLSLYLTCCFFQQVAALLIKETS